MCGIAAVVGNPRSARLLLDAIRHRGPDGEGCRDVGGSSLAMTRLAILDPTSRANQPMSWGDATIVFNGEVYNFTDLRSELESLGWEFQTSGDTEVVLKAFVQWGKGAPGRLRGMYALLLWRADRQELWAARDEFGIKPLYWAPLRDGGTCFASEASALAELVGRKVAVSAVSEFLHFGSPYSATAFEGVVEIPPGTLAIFSAEGRVQMTPIETASPSSRPAVALLNEAIRGHLVSDRPVAIFLSGGFDSALVCSQVSQSATDVAAVTIDTGHNSADVAGARRTAQRYGLPLHAVSFAAGDVTSRAKRYLSSMDQPTIDGFNTFLASDAANHLGFPVALSGLGGDEMLGGYGYYRFAPWLARSEGAYRRLPTVAQCAVAQVLAVGSGRAPSQAASILAARSTRARYQAWRCVFTADEAERLTGVKPAMPTITIAADHDQRRQLRELDFRLYLRSTLLRDVDVFSMACGVEVRVPLLDGPLVHSVASLPAPPNKTDFAAALGDNYLKEVATRKKMAFRVPWQEWIDDLTPTAELLTDPDPWQGLVDPREARALISAPSGAQPDRILALVLLSQWLHGLGAPRRIRPRPV